MPVGLIGLRVGRALSVGDGGWWGDDGAAGAPISTSDALYNTVSTFYQGLDFSTMLDRYAARPPWRVAGIDYPVGVNASAIPLKDPATITSIPNSTIYRSGTQIIVGANQVLDGYDMSLAGGYIAIINGASATVQNCYFKAGSNAQIAIGQNDASKTDFCTIQYNSFDANSPTINTGTAGFVSVNSGHLLIQYNYFVRANGEHIVSGGDTTGQTRDHITIQYNVFGDAGRGGTAYATHGDIIQLYSSQNIPAMNWANILVRFNTVCVDDTTNGGGAQGFSLFSANTAQSYVNACDVSYNTFCGASNAYASIQSLALFDPENFNGNVDIKFNYADLVSCIVSQESITNPQNSPFITFYSGQNFGNTGSAVYTYDGNISMTTGHTLVALSGYGGNPI